MAAITPARPSGNPTKRALTSTAQLMLLVGATCMLAALLTGAVLVAVLVELGALSR